MAFEFITTDLTTAYPIHDGDTVVMVADTSLITGVSGFNMAGSSDLFIAGHIHVSNFAVTDASSTEENSVHNLTIADTALIQSNNTTIRFANTLAEFNMTNYGRIYGEDTAVYVRASDEANIHNAGTIANYGDFPGYVSALYFYAEPAADINVSNSGILSSLHNGSYGTVHVADGLRFWFDNSGTVDSDGYAVLALSDTVRIENSGDIHGVVRANYGTAEFVMFNSGYLGNDSSGQSLASSATNSTIRNTGEISGDIEGTSGLGTEVVINAGIIGGDVNLTNGNDTYRASGNGVVLGLVDGGQNDDTLIGGNLDDRLEGGSGNDVLRGAGGDDDMNGGSGSDRMLGGNDNDTMRGGTNDDTMFGGNDDDAVYGEEGDDFIFGGYGNDDLRGGDGDDRMFGDAGDDEIDGGAGRDVINTGTGADTVIISAASDSAAGSATRDIVFDFTPGEDVLDLAGVVSGVLDFIDTAAFSGSANELRLQAAGSSTRVLIDLDKDAVADVEVLLRGTQGLTVDDFVL